MISKSSNSSEHFQIEHDQTTKLGLKHKDRFKNFLRFGLSSEKFQALDLNCLEFIDTEFLQKDLNEKYRSYRADVIAKVGLKTADTKVFVGIIVEHKSHHEAEKKIFLQALRYNLALLETGLYPIITVLLFHGKAPLNISSNLHTAFHLTSETKRVFSASALNFGIDMIDLRKKSEQNIKDKAGSASALCYALKTSSNMTEEDIKSVFELCKRDSKDSAGYREYAGFLSRYMLQSTDYKRSALETIEQGIISNKEDQVMPSTASRIFNEGREEGMEKGREEIVLKLLHADMSVEKVSKITGFSKEEIRKFQEKSKR